MSYGDAGGGEREPIDLDAPGSIDFFSLVRDTLPEELGEACKSIAAGAPHERIEVRHPQARYRPLALQILGSREVANKSALAGLTLGEALDAVYDKVPGLWDDKAIDIAGFEIFPRKLELPLGRFVVGFPTAADEEYLRFQLEGVQDALAEAAPGIGRIAWKEKDIDFTVAYIPRELPEQILYDTLELVESHFPERFTLGEAHCPGAPDYYEASEQTSPAATRQDQ